MPDVLLYILLGVAGFLACLLTFLHVADRTVHIPIECRLFLWVCTLILGTWVTIFLSYPDEWDIEKTYTTNIVQIVVDGRVIQQVRLGEQIVKLPQVYNTPENYTVEVEYKGGTTRAGLFSVNQPLKYYYEIKKKEL
jgi:hypothetical protein